MKCALVTRRSFLRASATAFGGIALGAAGYGTLIEPEDVKLERVDIHLPQLPEQFSGLKIAQLSDLHFGPFTGDREIGRAVDVANSESPDLVALTGDYVTVPNFAAKSKQAIDRALQDALHCANALARLQAPLGMFAVPGNHDAFIGAAQIAAVLESRSIHVLLNANHVLGRGSARLWLAGLNDVLHGSPSLELALRGIPRGEATVLLAHEPDFADVVARYPVHLQLSGHSHGGQMRVPLLGSPYLPPLARKYPYGYYRVGGMQLYTNRGIGTIILPMRLDAPPEVTIFKLYSTPPQPRPA